MKKSYEMDMCSGSIPGKLIRYSIPLMLSGILQLLFNAADIVVVGRFAGNTALAAVGSTSALINLLVNLFIGLSVGTNVLVAHYYGAHKETDVQETVHTSMMLGVLGGLTLIFIGVGFADPLLELMGTPEDVIAQSSIYMRIYFCGMPAMLVFNFGSAILRAIGDTKRPLYFLLIAGILNVGLNLFFVIVLHMGVAGVALATILSQFLSAFLIVRCLMGMKGPCRLKLKEIRLHKDKVIRMTKIGLPAGLQGALFSISNVLIQSSVNLFGSTVMAGNTAAGNIEGFVYTSMNTFYQANLSFTGQNIGGHKFDRVPKILGYCLMLAAVTGLVLGNGAYLFAQPLLSLYTSDPEVIQYGKLRLSVICTMYLFCGFMDVLVGSLRGIGYSVIPMIVSLTGACLLRVVWIFTVFRWNQSLFVLYISYPITWIVTASVHAICFFFLWKRYKQRMDAEAVSPL